MSEKINVLMSAYNEEKYLDKTIQSLLSQTFKDFNIIIIDDGSIDDTLHILRLYQKQYPKKIKIFTNLKNKGLTKSLNKGIKYCDAKYIARADANDFYNPNRLELQYMFLEENPKVAVVGTWREEWWPDTNKKRKVPLPILNEHIQKELVKGNCIGHSTTMIRGDVLRKYKYDNKFKFSQDSDLWARIGKEHELANLSIYLTCISRFDGSVTASKKKFDVLKNELKIRWKSYKNLDCPWWYFIYMLKPFIIFFASKWLIEKYINLKPTTKNEY